MKQTTKHLNPIEEAILKTLYKERRPLTIKEVSDKTKLSWVTVRKYLEQLSREGLCYPVSKTPRVIGGKLREPREKWVLNYKLIFGR